jgi:hypothetical protein
MSFSHGGYGDPMISRVGDEQVQLGIREKECHILVPGYTYTQGKGAPHPFSFASGYISGLVRTIEDDCLRLLIGRLNTLVKVYHGAHLIPWKIASVILKEKMICISFVVRSGLLRNSTSLG